KTRPSVFFVEEERFPPEAVPPPRCPPSDAAENGERPWPHQAGQRCRAPPFPGEQKNLCVGPRVHCFALHTQLATHFFVVVNLAVECDQVATIRAFHWLVSGGTQVKDGEPAIAQHGGIGHDDSFVVRPATVQTGEHGLNDSEILSLTAITVDPCDSAHVRTYIKLP